MPAAFHELPRGDQGEKAGVDQQVDQVSQGRALVGLGVRVRGQSKECKKRVVAMATP